MKQRGRVYLVGAGPGDPELLTLKAVRLLEKAEVIVHDRLVSAEVLALAPPTARRICVGKAPRRHSIPQDEINALLISLARQGLIVVRLKGGDPFIFGRGSEEMVSLRAAGVPFTVVPGVTAAQGCAAAAGVPLTHRGLASGVRYVTGHCCDSGPLALDWAGLANPETTLVVYMGTANIAEIAAKLIAHGMSGAVPALAISQGTTTHERRLLSRLDAVAADVARAGLEGPVLFILGRVVALYEECPGARLAAIAAAAAQSWEAAVA
ncbi:MAG: uroporphyrinogen-III C-methyltransferase [Pseudomonadota bacterium]